jgi:hypothetical protein
VAWALLACTHPARLGVYDNQSRPAGYHWVRHATRDPRFAEYYGTDPTNGWTVYVGPDGIYYTFAHAPPISTRDLHAYWKAHDAPRDPAARPTPR